MTTYYCCGSNLIDMGHMFGADWLNDQGTAAFASDPAWAALFDWQKSFIADVYGNGDFATGAQKLNEFISGAGGEWAGQQDFITGRTAIIIDGEWRNAFIKEFNPDLNYDTAPLPTSPDNADAYGSGTAGGTVLALPKGSPHPNEAWLLLRYLATDTDTLVYMANTVNNVPTTVAAINSPDLNLPPQFDTFMEVFQNPGSGWVPTTALGAEIGTYIGQFAEQWQAGKQTDLQAGLQQAQDQTDSAFQQVSGAP
jgi:multiple sugar transport system substrate-binding protein